MSTYTITENFLFSPLSLSNCCLWLDAADRTTLFTDTGGTLPVSTGSTTLRCWKDKSSSNNNATNTGSNPVVTFNSQNSLNTITFSTSNYLNLTSTSLPNGGQYATYFFVLKTTNTGVQVFFSHGPNPAQQYQTPQFFFASQNIYADTYGGTAIYDATPITNNYILTSFTRNTVYDGWLQGSSFVAANGVSLLGNTGTGFATLGIGRVGSTLDYSFIGDIAEVVIYNTDLDTTNRQLIEGHLANKWGINSKLPSNHPYYQYRPLTSNLPLPLVPVNPLFIRTLGSPPYSNYPTTITTQFFSPKSIANLSFWLDANDPNADGTQTSNNQTISNWKDKSTNAYGATAIVAATISKKSINGLDSMVFDGSSMGYKYTSFTINSATHTFFFVSKPTSVTANSGYNYILAFQDTGGGSPYIVFPYYNASLSGMKGYITSYNGLAIDYTNSTLVDNAVANAVTLTCAVIQSGSQQIYRFGSLQSSATASLSSATSPYLFLGAYPAGAGYYFNGNLCEVLVFNATLDASQRQTIEGYLAWKWGLVSSLPSSHPHKNIPPSA